MKRLFCHGLCTLLALQLSISLGEEDGLSDFGGNFQQEYLGEGTDGTEAVAVSSEKVRKSFPSVFSHALRVRKGYPPAYSHALRVRKGDGMGTLDSHFALRVRRQPNNIQEINHALRVLRRGEDAGQGDEASAGGDEEAVMPGVGVLKKDEASVDDESFFNRFLRSSDLFQHALRVRKSNNGLFQHALRVRRSPLSLGYSDGGEEDVRIRRYFKSPKYVNARAGDLFKHALRVRRSSAADAGLLNHALRVRKSHFGAGDLSNHALRVRKSLGSAGGEGLFKHALRVRKSDGGSLFQHALRVRKSTLLGARDAREAADVFNHVLRVRKSSPSSTIPKYPEPAYEEEKDDDDDEDTDRPKRFMWYYMFPEKDGNPLANYMRQRKSSEFGHILRV